MPLYQVRHIRSGRCAWFTSRKAKNQHAICDRCGGQNRNHAQVMPHASFTVKHTLHTLKRECVLLWIFRDLRFSYKREPGWRCFTCEQYKSCWEPALDCSTIRCGAVRPDSQSAKGFRWNELEAYAASAQYKHQGNPPETKASLSCLLLMWLSWM